MIRRWMPILVVMFVLALTCVSYACPMCKDSIPNSDSSQPVAVPSGFNNSVYTLLVGFLLVLAAVSGMIVKVIREPGQANGFNGVEKKK